MSDNTITSKPTCKACGHTLVEDALLLTGKCPRSNIGYDSCRRMSSCRPKTLEEILDFITDGCQGCNSSFSYITAEIKQLGSNP